jgi:serine/threonine protein kinase
MEPFTEDVMQLQRFRHKHLVLIFGICVEPLSIVMEMIPMSLFRRLHSRDQQPIKDNKVLSETASALAYLHRVEVCHGDLKSENVLMLAENDMVKVCDFGLAPLQTFRSALHGAKPKTRSMCYRSPELLSPRPRFSFKSDVFAFGVLAWEICARKIPFDRWPAMDIMEHTELGRREDIQKMVDVEMRSLVHRAWSQEPSQRPDMEDLVNELSTLWWASVRQMI